MFYKLEKMKNSFTKMEVFNDERERRDEDRDIFPAIKIVGFLIDISVVPA